MQVVVRLYCVFDRVAQLCGPIGDAVNDGVAWRNFALAMKDNPNRTDFQLLYLGTFDQVKGVVTPLNLPVVVEGGQLELELPGKDS